MVYTVSGHTLGGQKIEKSKNRAKRDFLIFRFFARPPPLPRHSELCFNRSPPLEDLSSLGLCAIWG